MAYGGSVNPDPLASNLTSTYIDRRHVDHSLPTGNNSGIENPVIDHAFETASRTVDNKVRAKNFVVVQRELNRRAYWISLFFPPDVWMTNGHIQNVSYSPNDGPAWNIWAWTVGWIEIAEKEEYFGRQETWEEPTGRPTRS